MRWVTSVSPAPADGHHWTRRGHDTGIARLQPCDDDDDDSNMIMMWMMIVMMWMRTTEYKIRRKGGEEKERHVNHVN